ncbi:YTH-domain-containing protein [Saitoella complicata NRRL Y-17804]|nr:YTH-domain-containing protein [Saitoella complicata NRRL Y-17804]ODQ53475.1 YTH-domain-containing protein [Saitoella complicata NRRL Y-17804]
MPAFARYFVIKSYSEDDIHKSLKYGIWASTEIGSKRLDRAFRESSDQGPIYLFFSVNASGMFCGVAQMVTPVDHRASSGIWAQDKWRGHFGIRWIFVKDILNVVLKHIRVCNNDNKPVTNSRDTQELEAYAGREVLRTFALFQEKTGILGDWRAHVLRQRRASAASVSASASGGIQGGF